MTELLDVSHLTKTFAGISALDDIGLSVGREERVGLIGPNGAGKTTLFNCLLGITRPDRGNIIFDGEDVGSLPVHVRARRGIGRTFQRIELFSGASVREHLLIAERARRGTGGLLKDIIGRGRASIDELERCDEVLALLGLDPLADAPIESLSLGKGRLVEVGRALMTDPQLLLLDEPSSGLDRSETAALAATLRQVQAERRFAILLVEHDVELVADFTERSYVVDFGTIIARGPTRSVMRDPVVRRAYLGDLEATQ